MDIVTWTSFKSMILSKALLMQYTQRDNIYDIYAPEAQTFLWHIVLAVDSDDAIDFDTNYKSACNKPLEIKAGAGRPIRAVPSAQPINTIQKFKGYQLIVAANATTASLDISFATDIYIKGGVVFSPTGFEIGDSVSMDAIYIANGAVIVPKLLDTIYLQTNTTPLNFVSTESMSLPSACKLTATITCPNGATINTQRVLNIAVEYFV